MMDRRKRSNDYVDALEEERRKVLVFQRELPLCLELVTQAIEACRRELSGTTTEHEVPGKSDCSEQTSGECPVTEEFIPIKPNSSCDEDEKCDKRPLKRTRSRNVEQKEKSDWLRSVQLWNQPPDPPSKNKAVPRKALVTEVKRNGAFQPFQKEKSQTNDNTTAVQPSAMSSTADDNTAPAAAGTSSVSDGGNKQKDESDKEGQGSRKRRRCWSPELHRRFLHALQQLGGSHVATPKQIRELMKVDGLTNDEVKSHLQKFRLHTRRPSHGVQHASSPAAAGPQFVVVGGIWVPPPADYTAMTGTGDAETVPDGEHRHPPQPPAPKQQASSSDEMQSEGSGSHNEDEGGRSCSPSTSSSTHTPDH
ncbi:Transcription factor HHO3 [Linum perenne]